MDKVINRQELVARMSEKTGFTKKDSRVFLETILEVIGKALAERDKVALVNFGTFSVKDVSARQARNPRTNEVIDVPAKTKPTFKFAKSIRESVKGE